MIYKQIEKNNFAVISCYWNPSNWKSIKNNYLRFLHEMSWYRIPVYTAEVAYKDQDWVSDNSTYKIRGNKNNIMWQKERLLNYIVEKLPENYKKIAWIDNDIFFMDPYWVEKVKGMLEEYSLVQLFDKLHSIGSNGELLETNISVGHMATRKGQKRWSPGGAWAGDRELFPLYDRSIIGGGDAMCLEGWLGTEYCEMSIKQPYTEYMKNHYVKWSKEVFQKTNGKLTSVQFDAFHFYHGKRENRQYSTRWNFIVDHGFDPLKHTFVEENGLLSWTKEVPLSVIDYVCDYFKQRNEDDYANLDE